MKKTLVAVAAFMAATGAMAEVTISGLMEIGVINTSGKTAGGTTQTVRSLGDSNGNNQINFAAKEDLGSGLSANVNFGILPSEDMAVGTTGYQTYMGLSGGFGSIKAGSFLTNSFSAIINADATGVSAGAPTIGIGMAANGDRTGFAGASLFDANQLSYTLPTFVTGLDATYTVKFGEANSGIGDATSYKVGYVNGPLSLAYAAQTGTASASATDKGTVMSANYDFGMAKLFLGYATLKQGTASTLSANSYGISVPVGEITLMYNYGTVSGGMATSTIAASTVGQNKTDVGAKYAFSKRTSVTYIYSNTNNGLGNSTTAYSNGSTNTTNKIYLAHSF